MIFLDFNSFFEVVMLFGSVGLLKVVEIMEWVWWGSIFYEEDVYKGFFFLFENLVFEGGGNKGMVYVGVL